MIFAVLGFLHSFFIFSQISCGETFPAPLSHKDEENWLMQLSGGSEFEKEEAKTVLIEHNLRLVAHIVKKYPNYSKDIEDLISIGTIGLIKAINTFKNNKGARLATYAARCIENAMVKQITHRRHSCCRFIAIQLGGEMKIIFAGQHRESIAVLLARPAKHKQK